MKVMVVTYPILRSKVNGETLWHTRYRARHRNLFWKGTADKWYFIRLCI